MKGWLTKHGRGFLPADEESEALHRRMEIGEAAYFEQVRVRDARSFKRYWLLMTRIAENVESIEIDEGVWMPIRRKEDAHTAMKLITGLYDTLPVVGTPFAIRVPKSTSFKEMTPDEWDAFLPRVLDAVHEKVLPGIEASEDLMRLAS